jgi:acyl-CoA synthetase (AMP-forming)/AMP-acid ligase II
VTGLPGSPRTGYEDWSRSGWRTHLPGVAEAAVASVSDERWGERVTAWVVLRDEHGFDEAALTAHARTLLAGYKCPKRVFRVAKLPRNQLGKIVRSALSELR